MARMPSSETLRQPFLAFSEEINNRQRLGPGRTWTDGTLRLVSFSKYTGTHDVMHGAVCGLTLLLYQVQLFNVSGIIYLVYLSLFAREA